MMKEKNWSPQFALTRQDRERHAHIGGGIESVIYLGRGLKIVERQNSANHIPLLLEASFLSWIANPKTPA